MAATRSPRRTPLRPLSVAAIDEIKAETSYTPLRGIHAGLSPAVKYADRTTRRLNISDLQYSDSGKLDKSDLQDTPSDASMKTRQSERLRGKSPKSEKKKVNYREEDIVKRLRAKLDSSKKKTVEDKKDEKEDKSSTSSGNVSSVTSTSASDVSSLMSTEESEDGELKAAKTASAKRKVLLQRKSKFRMSEVKKVAQSRRSISQQKSESESEIENIRDLSRKTKIVKAESSTRMGTRSRRGQSKSSSSDGDDRLRPAKRQVKSPKSTKENNESNTQDSSPAGSKVETITGKSPKKTANLNRTISIGELKGSGLVSSKMKGFEKVKTIEEEDQSERTPRRPRSKVFSSDKVKSIADTEIAEEKIEEVDNTSESVIAHKSSDTITADKPTFRSEITLSFGSASDKIKGDATTDNTATPLSVSKSEISTAVDTDTRITPTSKPIKEVSSKASVPSVNIHQDVNKSELVTTDISALLTPGKGNARKKRIVTTDGASVRAGVRSDLDVNIATTPRPTRSPVFESEVVEGTPNIKDILKVFRGDSSNATPRSAKKPEKLRRQSLEGTPSMKVMMKRFQDSVKASGGVRVMEEESPNPDEPEEEVEMQDVSPAPKVAISETPETEPEPDTTAIIDTPVTTRGDIEPANLATRWQHESTSSETSNSTPMTKGVLHHPGVARLHGSAKVSFSPVVMTCTFSKIAARNDCPNDSISSQSVSGESVGDESFESMFTVNKVILEEDEEEEMDDEDQDISERYL